MSTPRCRTRARSDHASTASLMSPSGLRGVDCSLRPCLLLRLPESMVKDTSFHAKVRSFLTFPGQSETYIRIVYFSEGSSEPSCNAEQTIWKVTPSVQSPVTKFPCRISRVSVDNLLESLLQNICHDKRLTSPSQHSSHGLSARGTCRLIHTQYVSPYDEAQYARVPKR